MNTKIKLNSALLAIFAALVIALSLAAGKGGAATSVAQAAAPNLPSVASSPLSPNVPTDWSNPVRVPPTDGYDNNAFIAASPIDGAVTLFWGRAPDPNTGQIEQSSNTSLNGAFTQNSVLDDNSPNLNGVMAAAHDSLGMRHVLYWSWPGTFCDHYAVIGTDGSVVSSEIIPGSCDNATPRKLGKLAIDANNTAHIVLGRNNVTDSMLYWERDAAGNWPVVGEYIAQNCCPTDLGIAVSSLGTVMVTFKSTGISGSGTDIFTVVRQGTASWAAANDISAPCCIGCPNTSGAYLPALAADYTGGIRAIWTDGRCEAGGQTDIYYREWVPGTGWDNQPIVQVVYNSGLSYYPGMTVDPTGEAHLAWSDDTSSPINNFRIFYVHGRGTVFSGVQIPFTPWDGNYSFQKQSSINYAAGFIHVAFSSNKYDPNKDNFYSNLPVASTPPTATPTLVPAPCSGERFHDVCPGAYYYLPVIHLNDAGIISGYSTSPPCPNSLWVPCFLPFNNATRGQMTKIVSLAAGFNDPPSGQTFQDVPPGSTFYTYTERLASRAVMSGYPCGGPNEPCVPPNNRPYFRVGNTVTRGQLTKMAAIAFGLTAPPVGQNFQDVPPGATYYTYTQQVANLGIITGYPCGGLGEPCVPPNNRPYYRPNNPVLRGQSAKILDGFRTQPTHTPTPVPATNTPTATSTVSGDTTPTNTLVPATDTPVPATSTPTVTGTPPTPTSTNTPTPPTSTNTPTPPTSTNTPTPPTATATP